MPYVTVGKENSSNIEIYYKDWGHSNQARPGIGSCWTRISDPRF